MLKKPKRIPRSQGSGQARGQVENPTNLSTLGFIVNRMCWRWTSTYTQHRKTNQRTSYVQILRRGEKHSHTQASSNPIPRRWYLAHVAFGPTTLEPSAKQSFKCGQPFSIILGSTSSVVTFSLVDTVYGYRPNPKCGRNRWSRTIGGQPNFVDRLCETKIDRQK